MRGNRSPDAEVEPDVGEECAQVIPLDERRAWRDVRRLLAGARSSWIEPPPELLDEVYARLDAVDRTRRHGRWVAYAGGLAAGAFVLASARRVAS